MKFLIEQSKEDLTSHSGLALVGALIAKTKLNQRLNQVIFSNNPNPLITNGDVAKAYIGLLCQGKNDFDHIEPFREDCFFSQSLRIKTVPSSPTLRQRLDMAGSEEKHQWNSILLEESARLLKNCSVAITPCNGTHVPLDIDVSPFDNSKTKKEGVSHTYKGYDGFSPIFAYIGQEGYLVNTDLRPGKDHSQNGTKEFLTQSILYARSITSLPLLVRMDSGNDSIENLKVLHSEATKADYIIKRNLRREPIDGWLEIAKMRGVCTVEREGKNVYIGEIWTKRKGIEDKLRIVFRVTEIFIEDSGQIRLEPDIQVDTFWTSLLAPAEEIIQLYADHGTSEQFHSEIKSDMDLERLPSGKFETNQVILHIGAFAYNVLRIIGQQSVKGSDAPLKNKAIRRRIRTVIQNLITLACRVVYHARYYKLSFGAYCPWFKTFKRLYQEFA